MWTSSRTRVPSGSSRSSRVSATAFALLVDLLAHEVVVAVLAGRIEVPVDGDLDRCHLDPIGVGNGDRAGPQLGDLVVLEHEEFAGQAQDRRNVRGEEAGRVGDPHQQGGHPPGGHDELGLVGVDHGHRKRTPDLSERIPHRGSQTVGGGGLERRLDEVDQDLRVGVRLEPVAGGGELIGELEVVLDDPVVDEGHAARTVDMGVGVVLGRTSMGRPTGVADPRRGPLGCRLRPLGQVVERTGPVGRPGPPQRRSVVGTHQGQAGRVVSPVLEAGQTLEQHPEHLPVARAPGVVGDPDDAAHGGEASGRPGPEDPHGRPPRGTATNSCARATISHDPGDRPTCGRPSPGGSEPGGLQFAKIARFIVYR